MIIYCVFLQNAHASIDAQIKVKQQNNRRKMVIEIASSNSLLVSSSFLLYFVSPERIGHKTKDEEER